MENKKESLGFAYFCSNYDRVGDNVFKHKTTTEVLTIEELYDEYNKVFKHFLISLSNYNEDIFHGCDTIIICVKYFDITTKLYDVKDVIVDVEHLFTPIMEVKKIIEQHINNNKEINIISIKPYKKNES